MSLLISDANIFIDFQEGGILRRLFELSDDIGVPDLLFEDELRDDHPDLPSLGLRLIELTEASVLRVAALGATYPRTSANDRAALVGAEQEQCPLVTGDRRLREADSAEGVEVHGTLRLARRLVDGGCLNADELECAYDRMKAAQRRLPWAQVEEQLMDLRGA